jgi:hypothetical protein
MNFTTISNAKKLTGLSYLGGVNISQKIVKSQKVDNIMTYCLYLSPAKTSGYQVCPFSTPECRKGCLATSGRAKVELLSGINAIKDCRINKTKLFFEHQDFFMQWLIAEISTYQRKAFKKNMGFAVRLNGTSDIDWQNIYYNGKNIFEHFSSVKFYDYTKQYSKFENIAKNYYLTLSYTGRNVEQCINHLNNGGNVAMVFNIKGKLPKTWKGFAVIDGDITDARFKDTKGRIAGLRWKSIADKQADKEVRESIFVIQPTDTDCTW